MRGRLRNLDTSSAEARLGQQRLKPPTNPFPVVAVPLPAHGWVLSRGLPAPRSWVLARAPACPAPLSLEASINSPSPDSAAPSRELPVTVLCPQARSL